MMKALLKVPSFRASHSVIVLSFIFSALSWGALNGDRRETFKSLEINVGTAIPASNSFAKKDPHYALGVGYSWDLETAFIEARFDFINRFSKPSQNYTAFTLGGNYVFLEGEVFSAYAGANFGLGFVKVSGVDGKGGFHIGGDMGALFLKDADVNLDLRMRMFYNTAQLLNSHPFMFAFLVGLRF